MMDLFKLLFMNKTIIFYLVLYVILFTSCRNSCYKAEQSINLAGIMKDIEILSHDSLLGRAPLKTGEQRTIEYLKQRMQKIGLEPAFDGLFTQPVPLVEIKSSTPDKIDVRTQNNLLKLKSGTDYVAWSPVLEEVVHVDKAELIFAGFGIHAPEIGWDDFKGLDVKGKVIVVIVNDPDYFSGDTSLFKGKAMTYYGRWRYKFEEAERQGALGCLIIHEEGAAGYPWSVVCDKPNRSEYFIDTQASTSKKCKLTGWITSNMAEKLFKSCGFEYEMMKNQASKRGFQAIALNSTITISIQNSWSKARSQNVAGLIRGSQKPDEVLVYCAHWDHLGIGKAIDGDSIYNGASDNAAAIAWMLSIAEAFKKLPEPPKRSVLFFSPTAEEVGLLGSEYFVGHPPFDIQKTIACFNNDVILFLGKFDDLTVTGLGTSELDDYLRHEAEKRGRYILPDPNPENGMFFRSDQLPFLKAGIPSLFAKGYSYQTDLGKERTQEKINEYWKTTYHKPCDEYDPLNQNFEGLLDDARLFFGLGFRLSNENLYPKFNEESEFNPNRLKIKHSEQGIN